MHRWNKFVCRLLTPLLLLSPVACDAQPVSPTIRIDTTQTYQTIDGWGTCLIAWREEWRQRYRDQRYAQIYAQEMGLNLLRASLWGPVCDRPVEEPDELDFRDFDFSVSGGRAQIYIEFAKLCQQFDPDFRVIATVWSPPVWMKVNGRLTDKDGSGAIDGRGYERNGRSFTNRVDPRYFDHFAAWVVEMAKYYESQGVPLAAISPGNEVMFTQTFESCVWSAKDWATVVGKIGRRLDEAGLDEIEIFGPETMTGHNWSAANPMYIDVVMDDPVASGYLDVFATHGYTDGVAADTDPHHAHEFAQLIQAHHRRYWMTEAGTGSHDWPDALREIGGMLHASLTGGNASAFLPWQFSEDKPTTHGLLVLDELTKKAWVARHFFRWIRPHSIRVDASTEVPGIRLAAFVNSERDQLTVVAMNMSKQSSRLPAICDVTLTFREGIRTDGSASGVRLDTISDDVGGWLLPAESIITAVFDFAD